MTRHKRVVGVMVSAEDYDAMRVYYKNRMLRTMKEAAAEAKEAGLTQEKLAELLEDES